VPVAAMGGITGRLYQQFAITIAISVAISSLNALTLSPALSAMLLRPPSERKESFLTPVYNGFNGLFQRATGGYMGIATLFSRKLALSVLALAIVTVLMGGLFRLVPGGFVPEEDQGYFLVAVQLPDAASLERTDQVTAAVEKILGETAGVQSVTAVAGYSLLTSTLSSNSASFFISLDNWADRAQADLHVNALIQQVNRRFAMEIPQAVVFAFGPPAIPGLGTGSGFSMMLQDRGGNTPTYLAEQTAAFIEAAKARPEIGSAISTFRANVPQIEFDLDREKAKTLGVPLNAIFNTLASSTGKAYANDFNKFGKTYQVLVQADAPFRQNESNIYSLQVRNNDGDMVPLRTLVKAEPLFGPDQVSRYNIFRSITINGSAAPGYSSGDAIEAMQKLADTTLPPGYTYEWTGQAYQEKIASGQVGMIFGMALLFVFLFLVAQYESWSLPLSVMLGTPIAVFGAIAGLWIARLFSESYVNNVFAQIGLVMLIGMAAKNAILIVEFASLEMRSGKSAMQAAMDAARARFRPILMTAFSFILGVLPLLVATGAGAEARKVMGMTVFSGMLVATVIGVLVVPAMFVFVEKYVSRRAPAATGAEH